MEYSSLIQDFFDGALDDSQECALFYQAASDETVRSEFKSYISIDMAFKRDSMKLIPPPSSTSGVFARIAFPNTASGNISPRNEHNSTKTNFFKKHYQNIITGVISSIVTALILLLFLNFPGSKNSTADIKSNNTPDKLNSISPIPNVIQSGQNFDNKNADLNQSDINNNKNNTRIHNIRKEYNINGNSNPEDKTELSIPDHTTLQNETELISTSKSEIAYSPSDFNSITNHITTDGILPIKNNLQLQPQINSNNLIGISIEFRGLQEWSLNNPTLQESSVPKFNNSMIALFYSLTDNIMIGIEARQEYFYQEFTGYDGMGNRLKYKQFPSLASMGVDFRYRFGEIYGIRPLIQLTFGGNKVGYIGRSQFGIEFSPYKNYSFILAGELGVLNFYHDNSWFTASKFGLNYGIRFNF